MEVWPISIPHDTSSSDIVTAIAFSVAKAELVITLQTTLNKHPGCLHWHLKRPEVWGTLEVTFVPSDQRAWFSVQSSRNASWISHAMHEMKQFVAQWFEVHASTHQSKPIQRHRC